MKRRLVLLLLLLVGGAIVNVTVAWWIALRPPPYNASSSIDSDSLDFVGNESVITAIHKSTGRLELSQEIKDWPGLMLPLSDYPTPLIPTWSRIKLGSCAIPRGSGTVVRMYDERATGWPYLACRCWRLLSGDVFNGRVESSFGAISISRRQGFGGSEDALPWLPVWPGFAINTVFYAFVLWLLFAAPFAMRRRRRIKRGLCPKCAYPVGASDVCTECGARVRQP